jgi:hypothetical protein
MVRGAGPEYPELMTQNQIDSYHRTESIIRITGILGLTGIALSLNKRNPHRVLTGLAAAGSLAYSVTRSVQLEVIDRAVADSAPIVAAAIDLERSA